MKGLLIVVLLCGALAACSGSDHEDLKEWMRESTKGLRGNIPKLPEVKVYEPASYDVEGMLDPFKPGKIEPEAKTRQASSKSGGFQPDYEARELRNNLLEKYPLETLKMIGYLNVNNRPIALIQVEQNVKQVKVGEYIGQDFGMVTRITDNEVTVHEMVQDSAGDWSERESSLRLQGKEGSKK